MAFMVTSYTNGLLNSEYMMNVSLAIFTITTIV